MNIDRFSQIVAAYGAKPASWPTEERQQALAFLQNNPVAKALIEKESQFEKILDAYNLPALKAKELEGSILSSIRRTRHQASILDEVLEWVLPENPGQLWQPALAASLPLVLGILFGINISPSELDANEQWDQDVYFTSLGTASEINALESLTEAIND